MNVKLTLTIAGINTGPFNIYSNDDKYEKPIETGVSRENLVEGYLCRDVPDDATRMKVKSTGVCTNSVYADITGYIQPTPVPSNSPSPTPTPTPTPTSTTYRVYFEPIVIDYDDRHIFIRSYIHTDPPLSDNGLFYLRFNNYALAEATDEVNGPIWASARYKITGDTTDYYEAYARIEAAETGQDIDEVNNVIYEIDKTKLGEVYFEVEVDIHPDNFDVRCRVNSMTTITEVGDMTGQDTYVIDPTDYYIEAEIETPFP